MPSLSLNFPAVLVACSIAAVGVGAARGDVIAGPILLNNDSTWQFSGIGFTANVDSFLTQFTFQNQYLADTVELVDPAGNVLDSIATPAGTPSDTVSVNWQLTAGDQYFLLQSTSSNSKFAVGGMLLSDSQITLTDSAIFSNSPVSGSFSIRGDLEWAAFNDITTVSAATSPVPEPSLALPLVLFLAGLLTIKGKGWRRAQPTGSSMLRGMRCTE